MFYSLYSFIRLADYLIVNTMHVLAVNSVSTLLNYLSEQLQNTPTLEQIQGFAEEAKQAADELKEDPETVSHTPTHPRPRHPTTLQQLQLHCHVIFACIYFIWLHIVNMILKLNYFSLTVSHTLHPMFYIYFFKSNTVSVSFFLSIFFYLSGILQISIMQIQNEKNK